MYCREMLPSQRYDRKHDQVGNFLTVGRASIWNMIIATICIYHLSRHPPCHFSQSRQPQLMISRKSGRSSALNISRLLPVCSSSFYSSHRPISILSTVTFKGIIILQVVHRETRVGVANFHWTLRILCHTADTLASCFPVQVCIY